MTENKRNLKVWCEVEIHPSAEEIAEFFWCMDSEEQAHFFNVLGGKCGLAFQLQEITDDPALTMSGRHAMQRISEYGEV